MSPAQPRFTMPLYMPYAITDAHDMLEQILRASPSFFARLRSTTWADTHLDQPFRRVTIENSREHNPAYPEAP